MGYTAIFGGTFNPPHIGHMEMLKAISALPEIEKILIMPTKIPPHKVCDFLASDTLRIEMCEILAKDAEKAEVCLFEFEREGKSYTYDTVKLFKEKYPEKEFAFVCGGDMLTTFTEWYRYEELLKMLPFYAFRRSDVDDGLFDKKAEELKNMGMRLTVLDKKITAAASTDIRNNRDALKRLVPESIYKYILERGIYGG